MRVAPGRCRSGQLFGTLRSSSASQAAALASDGIRQSPRGDIDPPALTLGPLGSADRLNWLAKNRRTNTSSQRRTVARSWAVRRSAGKPGGHSPASASRHACQDRNATLLGRAPWRSTWKSVKSWSE